MQSCPLKPPPIFTTAPPSPTTPQLRETYIGLATGYERLAAVLERIAVPGSAGSIRQQPTRLSQSHGLQYDRP
jgi:hypothetical protein